MHRPFARKKTLSIQATLSPATSADVTVSWEDRFTSPKVAVIYNFPSLAYTLSLHIQVNDKPLKNNLLIYGTPKLAYPYIKGSSEVYKDFSYEDECKSFLLTNKWDGYELVISPACIKKDLLNRFRSSVERMC